MHVKILIKCLFTSEELFKIICKYYEIIHEQIKINELKCKFNEIDKIAYEQVEISEFICKFDKINEITHE